MRINRLVLVFLVTGIVICQIGGALLYVDSLSESAEIRQSQIDNCEASKEPGGIRFIVAEQLRLELQQGKTVDYEEFFPNIPPEQLNELLQAQRERAKTEIRQLLDIDCDELYPKSTSP